MNNIKLPVYQTIAAQQLRLTDAFI